MIEHRKIKKILVANRGEIALRIMRSAREMGIKTVAIYSEADRNALHVRYADEALCVGPPTSGQSYLVIDKIIEAAKQTQADAIHPGYGFLSENANFAKQLHQEGLIFIGPSAESMALMGNKLEAKKAVSTYQVPLVPGTSAPVLDRVEAKKVADKIGYPVLIKAGAGGGGKGMRIVEHESQFDTQMDRAVSEAVSAFGDGAVFVEKYLTNARHIEFQIMGDQHGNVIHLFDRECSIQRRHQKVIEEAPSSVLDSSTRHKMGQAAVNVAKAAKYYNAGTVEFIVDQHLNFYFLEMNTRLQVEHPVTELITGLDLVKLQIQIAQGERIPFQQDAIHIRGHAIEARVYAEDPMNNFLPNTGRLTTYKPPQGPGIRVDDGFEQGMDIPIYYDPMIAKLVAYDENRKRAIRKMVRAIDEYQITGVETTLGFCRMVMEHESFTSGQFDTSFVQNHFTPQQLNATPDISEEKMAALSTVLFLHQEPSISTTPVNHRSHVGRWKKNRT